LFTIVYLPESPKFLHSKERYDEARNSLSLVARVNGIKNFNKEEIIFENEKAKYENNTLQLADEHMSA
jgi:hypothetical protein